MIRGSSSIRKMNRAHKYHLERTGAFAEGRRDAPSDGRDCWIRSQEYLPSPSRGLGVSGLTYLSGLSDLWGPLPWGAALGALGTGATVPKSLSAFVPMRVSGRSAAP